MKAGLKVAIVLAALCTQAGAQDPPLPPPTTDELAGVCWYEMLAALCDFQITEKQRAALESLRQEIRADSVDGEDLTARVMCASFQDDLRRGIEYVCTPLTREHVLKTLNEAIERQSRAR